MSVYIPGMEMPKSCFQCEFRTKTDPDNLMCIILRKTFEERFYHIEHRDSSCPLVPVPEHGDLIDRDALRDNNCDAFEISGADGTILAMDVSIIDAAPAIIPASKEGET